MIHYSTTMKGSESYVPVNGRHKWQKKLAQITHAHISYSILHLSSLIICELDTIDVCTHLINKYHINRNQWHHNMVCHSYEFVFNVDYYTLHHEPETNHTLSVPQPTIGTIGFRAVRHLRIQYLGCDRQQPRERFLLRSGHEETP